MMELIKKKKEPAISLWKVKNQLVISTLTEHFIVKRSEIMWIMADGNYAIIELENKKSIMSSKTLKSYSERLGSSFLRVHQSYLVNPVFIRSISRNMDSLKLSIGKEIPVSRSGKKVVQHFLNTYFD